MNKEIYTRVSKQQGKNEDSLVKQLEVITDYAKSKGFIILGNESTKPTNKSD